MGQGQGAPPAANGSGGYGAYPPEPVKQPYQAPPPDQSGPPPGYGSSTFSPSRLTEPPSSLQAATGTGAGAAGRPWEAPGPPASTHPARPAPPAGTAAAAAAPTAATGGRPPGVPLGPVDRPVEAMGARPRPEARPPPVGPRPPSGATIAAVPNLPMFHWAFDKLGIHSVK